MIHGVVRFFRDYSSRHRTFWNRVLHLVGVPLAFSSIYLLVVGHYRAAGFAFVGGYALQWLGHHLEGNEVGEWIAIKWLYARLSAARTR